MAGFVYIMSNPSFADERIKIGKSDRDPEEFRKSELNSTGVPEPFKVEYSAYVQNHNELEIKIHRHFQAQRPNKNREFFTCSIMDAISAIQSIAGETLKHEENFYAEYEELKREQEGEERWKNEQEKKERKASEEFELEFQEQKNYLIKLPPLIDLSVDWEPRMRELEIYISTEAEKMLEALGPEKNKKAFVPSLSKITSRCMPFARGYVLTQPITQDGLEYIEGEIRKNYPDNPASKEALDEKINFFKLKLREYIKDQRHENFEKFKMELRKKLEHEIEIISRRIDAFIKPR